MPSIRKKSFAAEQLAKRQQKKVNPVVWMLAGVVVIAVFIGGYVMYKRSAPTEVVEPQQEKIMSIAVLPFRDMSPNMDQNHFCEGVAEEILNILSKVKNLKVKARTSSFAFKGQNLGIKTIGDSLNADVVLEGSVRKSGESLRITAQLIETADENHIWPVSYDRTMDDIIAIQIEIAQSIVDTLKVTLLPDEKGRMEKRYTEDPVAWELFLLGRNEIMTDQAMGYLDRAIELDPEFALAYAWKASWYLARGYQTLMLPREAYTETEKWALKALEIDPDLADAHLVFACKSLFYDWEWDTAKDRFEHAIRLNPQLSLAHNFNKDLYLITGDFDRAISLYKTAMELDPVKSTEAQLTALYFWAGDIDNIKEAS